MPKYYFVTFESRKKDEQIGIISNIILKDIHPVVWAAEPPSGYGKFFTTYLHFWSEITEDIAKKVEKNRWVSIEKPD